MKDQREARPGTSRPLSAVKYLGAALALGLCGPLWAQGASTQAATAGPLLSPCRVEGVATEVQCGRLQRPLDPARAQGPQIEVKFVVVPAMARNKLPDPVLILAGGPGQSASALVGTMLQRFSRLNNRRDLVFVDQRGTGGSAPLQCDEDRQLSLRQAMAPDGIFKRLEDCRAQLEKLPYGDLRLFTTTIAMQDMDAVRAALGAEQWNVEGGSYGTRAALEYQRQFPQRVRRLVIDGVAPPDMALPDAFAQDGQAALDAVFASCAAQPDCARRYPTLRQDWEGLLRSLPRTVRAQHPTTGEWEEFTLVREALMRGVRTPLYVPTLASALPAVIHAAARGDLGGLVTLSAQLGGGSRSSRLATGMHFSVVCAEDLPRMPATAPQPAARDFGTLDRELYQRVCKTWPRGEVPAAFYSVPKASAAALVLSGGADPVTPPRHGERVTQALGPLARHVVVPEAGHGLTGLGCLRDVIQRFIEAPTDAAALQLKADCAAKMPRPPAYLPPTLAAQPAIAASEAAR